MLASLALVAACCAAPAHAQQPFVRPPLAVFAERMSVRPGERVAVLARGERDRARLSIVALDGEALVAALDVALPSQVDRDDEATAGCAWTPCAELAIPRDAPSDVYRIRLVDAGGLVAEAPLVVRASEPGASARTLVLYPELTLAAYGSWGGASIYPTVFGPPSPVVALGRPLQGVDAGAQVNRAFPRWRRETGLPCEHASELDLERDPALLDAYDLIVLPHHHEYWTRGMRAALDGFVENGGRVLALTGNLAYMQARLEDGGRRMRCHKLPELDPLWSDAARAGELTTAFSLGPAGDPPDRTFGLAFRHAGWATPVGRGAAVPDPFGGTAHAYLRAEGFGYLRRHAREHPFLADVGAEVGGLFGRRAVRGHPLISISGECDGANLERIDGAVLASRADGAPADLRILASAPAQLGFTGIAEHHRIGSVAHFGSLEIARLPLGDLGDATVPETLGVLANALRAYAAPRRSRLANGGFERWTEDGRPVGFDVVGDVAALAGQVGRAVPAVRAGGTALSSPDGGAVRAEIALPAGSAHVLGRGSGRLALEAADGTQLALAAPAVDGAAHAVLHYARVRLAEPVRMRVAVALDPGGEFDDVEVIDGAAWERERVLALEADDLAPGERLARRAVRVDGGMLHLLTIAGRGRGTVRVNGPDGVVAEAGVSLDTRGFAAIVVDPGRPGEEVELGVELAPDGSMSAVELDLVPLRRPTRAGSRPPPLDAPAALFGGGIELSSDPRIAWRAGEPARATLWTRGPGVLTVRVLGAGGEVARAELRGERDLWTPHVLAFDAPRERTGARLELVARGPVDLRAPRVEPLRLALRDDHAPNGAFELGPEAAELAASGTDWRDRPPAWTTSGAELLLDAAGPRHGRTALRITPSGAPLAVARLRIADALALDRAWRATLAMRWAAGAAGEVRLRVQWPGGLDAETVARAAIGGPAAGAWTEISVGATPPELELALDGLGAPARPAGAKALAWIEVALERGPVWIDDLAVDLD